MPPPLRPLATRAFLAGASLALRGDGVTCPCCGRRYRRFLAYPSRLCPGCGAYERHRALALLLERDPRLLPAGGRLLHVGPERAVQAALRARVERYAAVDIGHPLATHAMDVRALAFADGAFDAVLCLHVLCLLPDAGPALRELARVTGAGGHALFQEPGDMDGRLPAELADAGWETRPLRVRDVVGGEAVTRHGLDAEETFYACVRPS